MDSITVHVENSNFSLGISIPNPNFNAKYYQQYPSSCIDKTHRTDTQQTWTSMETEDPSTPSITSLAQRNNLRNHEHHQITRADISEHHGTSLLTYLNEFNCQHSFINCLKFAKVFRVCYMNRRYRQIRSEELSLLFYFIYVYETNDTLHAHIAESKTYRRDISEHELGYGKSNEISSHRSQMSSTLKW